VTAIYRFGRFELSPATRQLLVDDQPTLLGARAFDVLQALIQRRERLVTKEELLDLVWPGLVVEENNLQVQVSALRRILGTEAIATIADSG
jgi:DNA-binding winged helix-turn-helix (wHTH) protein